MRRPRQDQRKEKIDNLCQLIVDLDSIRAFRRIEPELLKQSFQKTKSAEIMEEWKAIRHDVEKISYMPIEIQGLPTLMRLAAFLKLLAPVASIFMVLTLASQMRGSKTLPIPLPAIFGERTIFMIAVSLSFGIMLAFVMVDYTIRRRVIKYEEIHLEKFGRGRKRIENVIRKLIEKLAKELKRRNEDPNNFKLTLFYKYEGLKVIKESRGRILRRKYPVYTAICLTE